MADKYEKLTGTVNNVTYSNPENGYFVAKLHVEGKRDPQTIVGYGPEPLPGEHLQAWGEWKTSSYGPQFKASKVINSRPKDLEGIEKYLANAVEGIGKGFAKKLVNAFGTELFEVIETSPERLQEIAGVGAKRAANAAQAIKEKAHERDIQLFLLKHGLSGNAARKIFERLGDKTIEILSKNPYELSSIKGYGFEKADKFGKSQGIEPRSDYRVRAGILHAMREAKGAGSCGLPVELLKEKASELLNVDYDIIERCIELEITAEGLIRDTANGVVCLFLPSIYHAEKYIGKKLISQASRPLARRLGDIDQLIFNVEMDIGSTLAESQRLAVKTVLENNVSVLTGGPGTGKTTSTKVILNVLHAAGLRVILCAPTGKAAKRATEATGFEAKTIHRVLEMGGPKGGFKHNEDNPLTADCLLLDETSMVDVALMCSLLKAVPPYCRIVFIGDVDQLPSVGAGRVLADIIASKAIPIARLTEVFRQAATSKIIRAAHAVNAGFVPEVGFTLGEDFGLAMYEPKKMDDEEAKKEATEAMLKSFLFQVANIHRRGFDPVKDTQVLCPMKKGPLGTDALNVKLQQMLNPTPVSKITVMGCLWGVGDKVIQMRNNYDKAVFNGEQGFVEHVDEQSKSIVVRFEIGNVTYSEGELDELSLAYALTIHKSQGSEFPAVLMPVHSSHYTMLKRNLLYTGITRAKKFMLLFSNKFAINKAVKDSQVEERYSRLKDWLIEFGKKDIGATFE